MKIKKHLCIHRCNKRILDMDFLKINSFYNQLLKLLYALTFPVSIKKAPLSNAEGRLLILKNHLNLFLFINPRLILVKAAGIVESSVYPSFEMIKPNILDLVVDHDVWRYSHFKKFSEPVQILLECCVESHKDIAHVPVWFDESAQGLDSIKDLLLVFHEIKGVMNGP